MASRSCFRLSPALKPISPFPQFPANQWVKVVDWHGITLQTLVHKVTATPETALIQWRRQGPLGPPTQGSFCGETDFNIYPTDLTLTIEILVTDPSVEIKVDYVGGINLPSP
jgi:hypothetical protein